MSNKNIKYYYTGRAINASDKSAGIEITIQLKDNRGVKEFLNGLMWLSPEMEIGKVTCNICNKDLIECDHVTGKFYNGIQAKAIMNDITFLGSALVDKPEDHTCLIKYLIIKDYHFKPEKIIIIEIIPHPSDIRQEYLKNNRKILTDNELKNADISIISTNEIYKFFFENNLKSYIQ